MSGVEFTTAPFTRMEPGVEQCLGSGQLKKTSDKANCVSKTALYSGIVELAVTTNGFATMVLPRYCHPVKLYRALAPPMGICGPGGTERVCLLPTGHTLLTECW